LIYAFEPNKDTFINLCQNVKSLNINCNNCGIGSQVEEGTLYSYSDGKSSGHASIYRDVFVDFHKNDDLDESRFNITTIDQFCIENNIDFIDFLKIDVEGHELEVLHGASQMINNKKIGVLQFEFNVCNIFSRVFLKDFYDFLKGYKIYRLDTNSLIPLFEYDTTNEIFKIQNFIAVSEG
jgi:FkbM family methyltransferase